MALDRTALRLRVFHSLITHESRSTTKRSRAASGLTDGGRPASVPLPPYHPDTPAFRRAWARYFDLITAMDVWVGDILDQLDEDGLAENTLVVFWSDHGASFPRAKRWANEAGVRVPLIARWPGRIEAGTARREVVQKLDLAPTVLNVAGIDIPAHMHGTPLLTETGETLPAAPYAYAGRDRMDAQEDTVRTIRDERFRYTLNLHPDRSAMQYNHYPDHVGTWNDLRRLGHKEGEMLTFGRTPDILTDLQRSMMKVPRPTEELYDIAADPHETRNLADDPSHAETKRRLRNELQRWRDEYGDLGTVPEVELLDRWRPGGVEPVTDAPVVTATSDEITAMCARPALRSPGRRILPVLWASDPESNDSRGRRSRMVAVGTRTPVRSLDPRPSRSGSAPGGSGSPRAGKCWCTRQRVAAEKASHHRDVRAHRTHRGDTHTGPVSRYDQLGDRATYGSSS